MQKVANLSASSPVFSACIFNTLFIEIPRYLEIHPIDFWETSHRRRHLSKDYMAQSISKENAEQG